MFFPSPESRFLMFLPPLFYYFLLSIMLYLHYLLYDHYVHYDHFFIPLPLVLAGYRDTALNLLV